MTESSAGSLTRAVELRCAPSIMDMKPMASLGPQISMTLSPITISMTPDWTTYMQVPGSPLLKTMVPAGKLTFAPAPRANTRMSTSAIARTPTSPRPRGGGRGLESRQLADAAQERDAGQTKKDGLQATDLAQLGTK